MKIHVLGACGTFMAGIVLIARELGHEVEGSDNNFYPPMSDQLKTAGIKTYQSFDATVAERPADLYIVGNVVSRGNPLFEDILKNKQNFCSGPSWLLDNVLSFFDKVIAVAGTNGKTITTTIVTHMLKEAGLDPSYLVGGMPGDGGPGGYLGKQRKVIVVEADEYDTAFYDKRPKFVHYWSDVTILNNIEFDHADIYLDLEAVKKQFSFLTRTLKNDAALVANWNDKNVQEVIAEGDWYRVVKFNDAASWHIKNNQIVSPTGTSYQIEGLVPVGEHNLCNVLAALAACTQIGVNEKVAIDSLQSYKLPSRRMQVLFEKNDIRLIDDFAHHPISITSTVQTLANTYKHSKLVILFEPRSYTMRQGYWSKQLADSFIKADVLLAYGNNLDWDLEEALKDLGDRAHVYEDIAELLAAAMQHASPNTTFTMLSSGDFAGLRESLLDALNSNAG